MLIQTSSKYNYGDIVNVRFNKYKHGTIQKGTILSIRVYQCKQFRENAFIVSYSIEPLEFEGYEHGEDEWISECSIIGLEIKE